MKVGDSVQILEGRKGIRWKVGNITEVVTVGDTLVGYKVRLFNGYIVPVLSGDVTRKTHKERGDEWRNSNT